MEPNGFLHLAHTPDILAGAATPLHRGVQFVTKSGICSLGEAIQMASLHPAQLFGLDGEGVGKLDSVLRQISSCTSGEKIRYSTSYRQFRIEVLFMKLNPKIIKGMKKR